MFLALGDRGVAQTWASTERLGAPAHHKRTMGQQHASGAGVDRAGFYSLIISGTATSTTSTVISRSMWLIALPMFLLLQLLVTAAAAYCCCCSSSSSSSSRWFCRSWGAGRATVERLLTYLGLELGAVLSATGAVTTQPEIVPLAATYSSIGWRAAGHRAVPCGSSVHSMLEALPLLSTCCVRTGRWWQWGPLHVGDELLPWCSLP